jgi:hypothetical protein
MLLITIYLTKTNPSEAKLWRAAPAYCCRTGWRAVVIGPRCPAEDVRHHQLGAAGGEGVFKKLAKKTRNYGRAMESLPFFVPFCGMRHFSMAPCKDRRV